MVIIKMARVSKIDPMSEAIRRVKPRSARKEYIIKNVA
jgi:hypothetical protein